MVLSPKGTASRTSCGSSSLAYAVPLPATASETMFKAMVRQPARTMTLSGRTRTSSLRVKGHQP